MPSEIEVLLIVCKAWMVHLITLVGLAIALYFFEVAPPALTNIDVVGSESLFSYKPITIILAQIGSCIGVYPAVCLALRSLTTHEPFCRY